MFKIYPTLKLLLLLCLQIGAIYTLSRFPDTIEQFYTNGIYFYWSKFLRFLFGWIPFSIGDVLYCSIIILVVRYLYKQLKHIKHNFNTLIYNVLGFLCVTYFLFYFFWGINYSRPSLKTQLNLSSQPYNLETLHAFSNRLIIEVNDIQLQLTGHDSLAVKNTSSKQQILNDTHLGYQNLKNNFPLEINIQPKSLKKSMLSLPLTYMGFSGYLNPFTGEAQVNHLTPKFSLPMTCSHEVAHQLGIASESEANFIGYLAAIHHPDLHFVYAAKVAALRYALYDIYRTDKSLYQKMIKKLNSGVIKNIEESRIFWRSHENVFEPFFKIFYDNFLKINQQKDGLKSYHMMVELLIAYDEQYNF